MDCVGLDFHPSAAAKALLPAPQFAVQEFLVDVQARGQAGKKGDQAFPMRFSGSEVAKHRFGIVSDVMQQSGTRPGSELAEG